MKAMAFKTVMARLLARRHVIPETGCWEWTASTKPNGYAEVNDSGKTRLAHRVAYEQFVGPIPNGKTLDHLCSNRKCINPMHLEPVPMRENVLRGTGPTAMNAVKTHCKQGHPYAGENLYIRPNGGRDCKECNRERVRAYEARKRRKEAA